MKKSFKISFTLLIIAVLAGASFYIVNQLSKKQDTAPELVETRSNSENQDSQSREEDSEKITWGFENGLREFSGNIVWKTYKSNDVGISFEYPEAWDWKVVPANEYGDSGISFRYPNQEGPFYQGVSITRWGNIDEYLKDGDLNLRPGESFSDLHSYATSRSLLVVPDLSVGGEVTYFRMVPAAGAVSVLITEHNGDIYEVMFVEKDPEQFTFEDQRFIRSIKFLE